MSKLIINNITELTDFESVTLIGGILCCQKEKNSWEKYCYKNDNQYPYTKKTTFDGKKYIVFATKNKSDVEFKIKKNDK